VLLWQSIMSARRGGRLLYQRLDSPQVAGALFAAGAPPHGALLVQLLAVAPTVGAFSATALTVRMRSLRPATCSGDLLMYEQLIWLTQRNAHGLNACCGSSITWLTASLQHPCTLQVHASQGSRHDTV